MRVAWSYQKFCFKFFWLLRKLKALSQNWQMDRKFTCFGSSRLPLEVMIILAAGGKSPFGYILIKTPRDTKWWWQYDDDCYEQQPVEVLSWMGRSWMGLLLAPVQPVEVLSWLGLLVDGGNLATCGLWRCWVGWVAPATGCPPLEAGCPLLCQPPLISSQHYHYHDYHHHLHDHGMKTTSMPTKRTKYTNQKHQECQPKH